MSKILFDTFTYRWRNLGGSYYFGRNVNNDLPQFEELEKQYYLNQLITALLIHDKISIKIDSLEELELLIGIDNVLRLFNEDCLEIIDDGGTMEGFLIGRNGENIFMNFSGCTGLQLEAIEERLKNKYKGRFEDKKVGPLLLNVESKRIVLDGAWLSHIAKEELTYDFNNQNLTQLLGFKSESYVSTTDEETLSLMRLCYLNKGLVYQNEIKADFLLTEDYSKEILLSKVSPILTSTQDPQKLFTQLSHDKKIPELAKLVIDGTIKFEQILELRNSVDGKKFRVWFESMDYDKNSVYEEIMKFNSSISSNSWVKLIRWIYPNVMGLLNPIAGIATSAIDSYLIDKLLKGWHPNFFLDEKLRKHIDSEITKRKNEISEERRIKLLGRKVGRNEKCPCGSNKKFKNCCGQ